MPGSRYGASIRARHGNHQVTGPTPHLLISAKPHLDYRATGSESEASGGGVRSTDGEELGRVLDEQLAYYRALAEDYVNQGLDLPGGDEVTEALDGFRPTRQLPLLIIGGVSRNSAKFSPLTSTPSISPDCT
jgi:hypothetical protein